MSPSPAVSALLLALAVSPARGEEASGPHELDPEVLIRKVVRSQKLAEERLSSYTDDQREVETHYAKDGRPKDTTRRLFYVFSGAPGEESTRQLVEVDGRPATDDEKKKAFEEDEKGKKKRLERKA